MLLDNHPCYWHLTSGEFSVLINNACLREGYTLTPSAMGVPGAVTPYTVLNNEPENERIWEEVRSAQYPSRPTRINALFVFAREADADHANRNWFGDRPRRKVRIQCVSGEPYQADSKWLDNHTGISAEIRATNYWEGKLTGNPFIECIYHGAIYLPDWRSYQQLR